MESDDGGSQLGFAFSFLVGRIDTVEIGVSEFPCQVEMSPDVVDDFFEPSLPCEFLGADVVLVVNVVLLDLDPVVAEAASESVVPADTVLRRHEELEACFSVGGGSNEERIILQSTADADHGPI